TPAKRDRGCQAVCGFRYAGDTPVHEFWYVAAAGARGDRSPGRRQRAIGVDLRGGGWEIALAEFVRKLGGASARVRYGPASVGLEVERMQTALAEAAIGVDRKSTRLNSSHVKISY